MVAGGFRTRAGSDVIRIDNTQHAMDAFRKMAALRGWW
jgi:hypothetical protein